MFESCVVTKTLFRSFSPVRNETKRTSPTNFKCQSYVPSWSSRKAFDVFTKTPHRNKTTDAMFIEKLRLFLRLAADAFALISTTKVIVMMCLSPPVSEE